MNAVATAHFPARDRRSDSLLRIKDVIKRTGLSSSTIYRRAAEGTFPAVVRMGVRTVAWYQSDIDDFVAVGGQYRRADFNPSSNAGVGAGCL